MQILNFFMIMLLKQQQITPETKHSYTGKNSRYKDGAEDIIIHQSTLITTQSKSHPNQNVPKAKQKFTVRSEGRGICFIILDFCKGRADLTKTSLK